MKYTLILIYVLSVSAFADETKWPSTVAEAVKSIIASMDENSKQQVKRTDKMDLIQYHHAWGTVIRNSLGLWQGNNALINSACGKPCHPDDASMKIIEAVWLKLNEKP